MRGFTLIEVLLSVALLSVLSALSMPVYVDSVKRNDVHIAADTVTQTLRRAQALSRASQGDSEWGVHVAAGAITLYRGTDYNLDRDAGFEETFEVPEHVIFSGASDIAFGKLTGEPQTTGTITSTSGPTSISVTMNSKGMVE